MTDDQLKVLKRLSRLIQQKRRPELTAYDVAQTLKCTDGQAVHVLKTMKAHNLMQNDGMHTKSTRIWQPTTKAMNIIRQLDRPTAKA